MQQRKLEMISIFLMIEFCIPSQDKYPHFSRTVPVEAINMEGVAGVVNFFQWNLCAVLYSDDELGTAYATAFQQIATKNNIEIRVLLKFKAADTNDAAGTVSTAVLAIKQSGVRVILFLAQGDVNLINVLRASRDQVFSLFCFGV